MELACRDRPITAAANDVGNGLLRRFPDPPPPQPHGHGDANASTVDAALLTRREELLWELHKERIRQDMILRELVETERALGFTAAGHNPVPALPWSQDDWRSRTPSVLPWEEAPPRLPCSGAQHPPSCCCGSSTTVRAPPLYPRVEISPSPPRLLQLQSVTDAEKQQDCRSSGARTHPTSGHVALCTPPNSKRTLEEDTSITVAPNAIVRSMRSGSIHEDLASTYHRTHDSWGRKAAVEDCHGVELLYSYEGTNRKIGERGAAEFSRDKQIVEAVHWPGRYSLSGKENAASYQQKRVEFSEAQPAPDRTLPGNNTEQHQEGRSFGVHPFSGYVELCRSPSNQTPVEETLVPVAAKVGVRQMMSAPFCGEARSWHQQVFVRGKVDVEDGHGMPLHEIKNRSNEEWKARYSAIEDCLSKSEQQGLQYKPANQDKAANNEQKRTEFNEPSPGRTSSGVKRKLTAASPPPVIKRPKPLGQWSCDVCQSNPHSQRQLDEHLAGKRHQANVAALQASRSNSPATAHNTNTTPPTRSWMTATNASESPSPSPSPPRRDGKEEVSENRWTCWVCNAKCTCQSDYLSHLGGRRHRENAAEVRRAVFAKFHCAVCDVQCNSEKMLASHLAGRRHREALEGSDSDSD